MVDRYGWRSAPFIERPEHAILASQRDMEKCLGMVTLRTTPFEIRTYGPINFEGFFEGLAKETVMHLANITILQPKTDGPVGSWRLALNHWREGRQLRKIESARAEIVSQLTP